MADPTKAEIARAHNLIEEVMGGEPDELLCSDIEVDSHCCWRMNDTDQPCGEPIAKACILFDEEIVQVVVYCEHHGRCMTAAARSRKEAN